MSRLLLAALAAVVTAVGVIGAVATAGGQADSGPPPRNLSVDLDEWEITTSSDVVQAGQVEVSQLNTGKVEHELLIVRTDAPADDLPKGLQGVKPSLAGKIVLGREHNHHSGGGTATASHLRPDRSQRDTVRLRPARYVLLCTIPGHYEQGQYTELTVR